MLKAQKEGYFNGDLKIRRRWRQRWRGLKAIGLISKTTTLHVHHTYFVRRRCPTTTWNCLFSRFVEDVNKAPDDIFSLFLNLEIVLRNSTPRKFAKNWQSKWLEIIAKIKKNAKSILKPLRFQSPPSPSSYLKVPNKWLRIQDLNRTCVLRSEMSNMNLK